jgi:hypothetical protein
VDKQIYLIKMDYALCINRFIISMDYGLLYKYDYGLLYKYGLWTCKLSVINCKKIWSFCKLSMIKC